MDRLVFPQNFLASLHCRYGAGRGRRAEYPPRGRAAVPILPRSANNRYRKNGVAYGQLDRGVVLIWWRRRGHEDQPCVIQSWSFAVRLQRGMPILLVLRLGVDTILGYAGMDGIFISSILGIDDYATPA